MGLRRPGYLLERNSMSAEPFPVPIGLIGFGSMGSALAGAMTRAAEFRNAFTLHLYAKNEQVRAAAPRGILFAETVHELVSTCGIIIVAVRPEQMEAVVCEIAGLLPGGSSGRKILISVAAGVTLKSLRKWAGNEFAVIRIMPNTLVEVGKGLFGFCAGPEVSHKEKEMARALLNGLGTVIDIDEGDMNAFTALAGCGPGFLFHIMDSLCEAGVSVGLARKTSQTIAAALMDGCASLAIQTGRHPVILREQGTSPSGMTIAGLNHLDRTGIRGHIIDAARAALDQGKAMDSEMSCLKK